MKRTVWADEQVEAVVKSGFTPVMIDLDDPNAAATVSRYRVVATPTTILTDPQGTVLKWRRGGFSKAEFLEFLAKPNPDRVRIPTSLINNVAFAFGSMPPQ